MVDITREKIRAEIKIGAYYIRTPDIKSFTVNRSRGNPMSTFNATLEVEAQLSDNVGLDLGDGENIDPENMPVIVRAGADGTLNTIFRGFITGARVSPSWEKMDRVLLNVEAKDIFYRMEGRSVNRRNPFSRSGRWVAIRGIVRRGEGIDVPPGAHQVARGVKSGRRDIFTGDKIKLITTPDVKDYIITDEDEPPKPKKTLTMSPELSYVGGGSEVSIAVDSEKNDLGDYEAAYQDRYTSKENVTEYWDTNCPEYVTITVDSDNPRNATIKFNETTYPGISCVVTFYSDQRDPTTGSEVEGKVMFVSVVPHSHESMSQGGPAFGTFG